MTNRGNDTNLLMVGPPKGLLHCSWLLFSYPSPDSQSCSCSVFFSSTSGRHVAWREICHPFPFFHLLHDWELMCHDHECGLMHSQVQLFSHSQPLDGVDILRVLPPIQSFGHLLLLLQIPRKSRICVSL